MATVENQVEIELNSGREFKWGEMYTGIQGPCAVGGFCGRGGDPKIMVDLAVREDTLEVAVGKDAAEQDVGANPFVHEPVVQGIQRGIRI